MSSSPSSVASKKSDMRENPSVLAQGGVATTPNWLKSDLEEEIDWEPEDQLAALRAKKEAEQKAASESAEGKQSGDEQSGMDTEEPSGNRLLCSICATVGDHDDAGHDAAQAVSKSEPAEPDATEITEPSGNRLLCNICATVGDHDDAGHDAAQAVSKPSSPMKPAGTDATSVPPAADGDTVMTAPPVLTASSNTHFEFTSAMGEENMVDMTQRFERVTDDRGTQARDVEVESPGEQGEDDYVPLDCTDLPPQAEYWSETPGAFKKIKQVVDKYQLDPDGKTAVLVHKDYRKSDTPLFKLAKDKKSRTLGTFRPDQGFRQTIAVAWNCKIVDEQRNPGNYAFSRLRKNDDRGEFPTVEVRFGLGTQIPYMQLRVSKPSPPVKEGEKPAPRKFSYVYIHANNLSRKDVLHRGTEGKPIDIHTSRSAELKRRIVSVKDSRPELNQLLLDNKTSPMVTEVKLRLLGTGKTGYYDREGRRSKPIITGHVTRAELDSYAQDVLNHRADQPEDEKFLGLIHAQRIDDLSFFIEYQDKKNTHEYLEHMDFARYFRYVMTVAAEMGNMWYFRAQTKADWQSSMFAFGKLQIPRWTVRYWHKSLDSQRPVSWADRDEDEPMKPALWAPLSLPEVYPGEEEMLFVQRCALACDRKFQFGYVSKLCESHGNSFDVILFKNQDYPKRFIVEVYSNMDMHKLGQVMPHPDTPLKIKVQGGVTLTGRVLTSGQSNHKRGLEFVCDMSAPRDDLDFKDNRYPATLEFTDDNNVFQRMMSALQESTKGVWRTKGIYIPNVLYGTPVPDGKDPNFYHRTLPPLRRAEFAGYLESFKLSDRQRAFAMDGLAPQNALAMGQGPPGTGKSTCIVAVVTSLTKMGFKVLICAPTNGAVQALLSAYTKKADMKSAAAGYTIMSSEFSKSGYRNRTQKAKSTEKSTDADAPSDQPSAPISGKVIADPFGKLTLDEYEQVIIQDSSDSDSESEDDDSESEAEDDMSEEDKQKKREEAEAEAAVNAYFHQQSRVAAGSDLLNQAGYDYRRMQIATLLASRNAHKLHALGKRYLKYANKSRLSKQEAKRFAQDENALNAFVLGTEMKVVFTTCNSASNPVLTDHFKPDYIVIDEAGCGTTADIAIPLVANKEVVRSVILVGDHKQLPPTIVSKGQNWGETEMSRTIFKRLADMPEVKCIADDIPELHFFNEQHRSHPDIMAWPSNRVYKGLVEHGPSTTVPSDVSRTLDEFFRPCRQYFEGDRQRYRIGINIEESEATQWGSDTSMWNESEVQLVLQVTNALLRFEPKDPGTRRLTAEDFKVITAYSGQRKAITSFLLSTEDLHPECGDVPIETISSAQGKEAPITIFTLVRYDREKIAQVGFLKKIENLNVAMTRAQKMSVVVGAFRPWLQGVADKEKDFTNFPMKHFVSFISDMQSHVDPLRPDSETTFCDIIHASDLTKAYATDRKVDLTRDKTDWPREFEMAPHRQELLIKLAGKKRGGNKKGENVKDAATGDILKARKGKDNQKYVRGD
jgi:hypothetical protein